MQINMYDLNAFWCRDEYCNKTLSEILPAYKEYLKQKEKERNGKNNP